jgi:hypothetical protein
MKSVILQEFPVHVYTAGMETQKTGKIIEISY